jgi:hypothetical protein
MMKAIVDIICLSIRHNPGYKKIVMNVFALHYFSSQAFSDKD